MPKCIVIDDGCVIDEQENWDDLISLFQVILYVTTYKRNLFLTSEIL